MARLTLRMKRAGGGIVGLKPVCGSNFELNSELNGESTFGLSFESSVDSESGFGLSFKSLHGVESSLDSSAELSLELSFKLEFVSIFDIISLRAIRRWSLHMAKDSMIPHNNGRIAGCRL